ncbi:MAG: NUDIX hydrolase [Thermodesulfobacteriota bacterium]
MIKPWPIIKTTDGPNMGLFSVRVNRCRSPRTGQEHDFYVIDFPNWVQVVPITPHNQVVMISQYRHGCGRTFLELPGGLTDEDDSSPQDTAARELLEETGYRANDLVLLAKTYPQPAVLSNSGFTFVATGVEKVADPMLDAAEDIEVNLIDMRKIPDMMQQGEINHGQSVMALSMYLLLNQDTLPESERRQSSPSVSLFL